MIHYSECQDCIAVGQYYIVVTLQRTLCTLVLQSHSMIFILLMEANGCRECVINSYIVCTVSQIEGALITLEEFVFHN